MSPKQQRGEATADRLLTTALQVYAASGQQGFTVNAVTAASGVSLGSLYHHFGSFDGLAAALYTRCMEELFEELTSALTRTRTARTGVRAVVRAYLRFTEERPDAALFLHASAYSGYLAAHADRIREAKATALEGLVAWMRPRIEAGEIAPAPEPLIEALVIGPVAETARRWLSSTYDVDLAEAARVLPDRIWRSLSPE
ncbi:TetR family transcriptional regulator [Streptomyces eurocidicus]|uniref:AcrR family transcriptional regulator n=1 Tax=Streptomyces eurocidicus TaxID=66423 RepID=A0A2N8P0C9_STREU|nr:TetR/AcrR family transcriptional regulator [Streptomyces eurocidicus]MBB5121729.1 AcrR family transcriptional regulator [Streptomyces eurocidicus]MBF6052947.1 TetR family transcriptional regulator [Streptomyces eurocidicus]PNE34459.1 TetR family transcriptional regulator [Streptomyces eurocidicus]